MYMCCMLTLSNRSIQEEEEGEEEAPEFVAEDEIEESDLSDIEVHNHPIHLMYSAFSSPGTLFLTYIYIKIREPSMGTRLSAVIYRSFVITICLVSSQHRTGDLCELARLGEGRRAPPRPAVSQRERRRKRRENLS